MLSMRRSHASSRWCTSAVVLIAAGWLQCHAGSEAVTAPSASASATTSASTTASAAPAPSASAASAAPAAAKEPLSEQRLMAHVAALTTDEMAGRRAGTEQERLAAAYIRDQLKAWDIPPVGDDYFHLFPFGRSQLPDKKSVNVVATLRGSGPRHAEHVILGAHLDHMGREGDDTYHGAEDNASGVAVVLEIANALRRDHKGVDRSITFVFFGAEEAGLVGSRAFAASPPVSPMVSMVNIDMIGRDLLDQAKFSAVKALAGIRGRETIGVLGTRGRPLFRGLVDAAAKAEGLRPLAPEDLPSMLAAYAERMADGRGDSFSFEDVGVPALFFGQGESDDYHKPTDTADKLVPHALAARARTIRRVVVGLSQADMTKLTAPPAAPASASASASSIAALPLPK